MEFAKDPDSKVRAAAVGALAHIDPNQSAARTALLAAVKDADAEVRRRAVRGLARLEPPAKAALAPLRDLLADPDVGADAAYALLRLGDDPKAPAERLAELLSVQPPLNGALALLKRFGSVTVLNGHIHQLMQKVEGNVTFHTAMSTAFPQPAPGTAASPGPMLVPAEKLRTLLGLTSVEVRRGRQPLAITDTTLAAS